MLFMKKTVAWILKKGRKTPNKGAVIIFGKEERHDLCRTLMSIIIIKSFRSLLLGFWPLSQFLML
jgi:hypothetical protein